MGPDDSTAHEARERSWREPQKMAFAILWIGTTIGLMVMIWRGVRETGEYETLREALRLAYSAVLVWHLVRTGRPTRQLPELGSRVFPTRQYGAWVPVAGMVLLLVLSAFSEDGVDIILLLLLPATLWTLVAWRRGIRWRSAAQGLVLALIACLAGLVAARNGFISETTIFLLAGVAAPMYVAGGLLLERTRLGGIELLAGRYGGAVKSFLWGAVYFYPLGLMNAAEGSPGGDTSWVTEWWMPWSLPWFSGIAEEVWFRLFLVGLAYFLLRPALPQHPGVAVTAAVLFSAIVFGLGHGWTLERLLVTGLLYGLPMAVAFARRDWEHAVGAHYMVNLVPWWMAYLES